MSRGPWRASLYRWFDAEGESYGLYLWADLLPAIQRHRPAVVRVERAPADLLVGQAKMLLADRARDASLRERLERLRIVHGDFQ